MGGDLEIATILLGSATSSLMTVDGIIKNIDMNDVERIAVKQCINEIGKAFKKYEELAIKYDELLSSKDNKKLERLQSLEVNVLKIQETLEGMR